MTTNFVKKPVKVALVLVYLLALALLLGLGGWQLARGLEKNRIEEQVGASQSNPAKLTSGPNQWQALNYATVTAPGRDRIQ